MKNLLYILLLSVLLVSITCTTPNKEKTKKKQRKNILLLISMLFLCCCNRSIDMGADYRTIPVDSIFRIIDCIDTHKLKNTIIFKRHKIGNLYLLGKEPIGIDVYNKYYVYVNTKDNSILECDSLKSNNYFTRQDIESIMSEYFTFAFPRIIVDSLGNIYANPYEFENIVFMVNNFFEVL
jgi:hypothetical protein